MVLLTGTMQAENTTVTGKSHLYSILLFHLHLAISEYRTCKVHWPHAIKVTEIRSIFGELIKNIPITIQGPWLKEIFCNMEILGQPPSLHLERSVNT